MTRSLAEALDEGPIVLDGGLATTLESHGHDLGGALWSARLLADDVDAVVRVHREFAQAGAQVLTTASYQLSADGLVRTGRDADDLDRLLARSVAAARRAAAEIPGERWVAGSVGPYGAALADGSEYRGDYGLTVEELRAWHRPRLAALIEAAPDVLALETVPCMAEVEALLAEVAGTRMPCWLSLTAVSTGSTSTTRTRLGEPVEEAFSMARDVPEVVAVGVNCCDPAIVAAAVRLAASTGGKPAVAYPNAGEEWDARARSWTGHAGFDAAAVTDWIGAGASLVGGCCRVGPPHIERVASLVG